MSDRPTTTRVNLTPPQMARLKAAGWQPGSMNLGVWLTMRAEDAKRLTGEVRLARAQRDHAFRERDYWAHRRRTTADERVLRLAEQRDAARRERDEARADAERLRQAALEGMLKVWITAYNAGHHDTVEAQYADPEPDDDVIHEYLVEAMEVIAWGEEADDG